MREIRFRGKKEILTEENKRYTDGWIYSDTLYQDDNGVYLIPDGVSAEAYHRGNYNFRANSDKFEIMVAKIKPETLGQYTGLKDKNGTKIYEGDIVITEKDWDIYDEENKTYHRYVIKFTNEGIGSCGCCYETFSGSGFVGERVLESMTGEIYTERCHMDWGCEIIGNIYDNPELLDKGE